MSNRYQVVIVGGGPVGLTLAVDLGRRNISCALVERRAEPHHIPKGQLLTHRTIEHFYSFGLVEELRAARLMPRDYPIGEITTYGTLNGEYWHAPAGRELVRPYFLLDNDRMPQYQLESVLREKLKTFTHVRVLPGRAAKTITQDSAGVRVEIVQENSGFETLQADYVVGCDGGHSLVREQCSITRSGADFDQLMMLAVFRSAELNAYLQQRFPQRSTFRVVQPELKGYWQFFGRIDGGDNWFFHAPVPASTTRESCDVQATIRKAVGFDVACAFEHVGFWDLRVLVADRYRDRRAFIAGDAAHSHPPYGGYGLNNGLEDAINLGWKLEAALRGWGGELLLDSYSQERQPVFKEIGEFFISKRVAEEAEFLERHTPERDGAAFVPAWIAQAETLGKLVKQYEPHYAGSGIVMGPPDAKSGVRGRNVLKAQAGHHLAPRILSSGQNVFAELGTGFALLALDMPDAAPENFAKAAKQLNVPLKIIQDSYQDGREAYEARLILARPDQFIAWAADVAPALETASAILTTVVGR